MRRIRGAAARTEISMQRTRKPSFLKSIFGAKQRADVKEPKKAPTPLDGRQLREVAGGTGDTSSPRGGW
jgi:hypothetical protein